MMSPDNQTGEPMRAICCLLVAVSLLCSAQGVRCAEGELGARVARIGTLLENWPRAWSEVAARRQMKIITEIVSMPVAAEVYLDDLFDRTSDPAFVPPDRAVITAARRKKLLAARGRILYVATMLSKRGYWPYINTIVRDVPVDKRPGAARFLDRFCAEIRPKLFRRALAVSELGFSYVDGIDDLRVRDALAAYCKQHDRPMHNATTVRLLRHAAGQRDLMRSAFTEKGFNKAFDYLLHSGDGEFLARTLLARLKTEKRAWRCGEYRRRIGRIDVPEARRAFLRFLDEQQANLKANENQNLWIWFPDFFDKDRAAWYIRLYRDNTKTFRMRRYGIVRLFQWLRKHERRDGVELARWVLTKESGQDGEGRRYATDYLLALRDKQAIARVRKDLAGEEKTVNSAMWYLVRAGLWDGLPPLLETRLSEGRSRSRVYCADRVLDGAEEYPDRKAHRYVSLAAQNEVWKLRAYVLLVRMGDRNVVPRLKKLLPAHWAVARVPAMAALYEAGEADQFDGLLAALRTEGFPPETRAVAARALGAGPKALRAKAARALVGQLLSPYGAVSEAAHLALAKLSGRKDIAFSPWATDDVRKKQAAARQAWLADLPERK